MPMRFLLLLPLLISYFSLVGAATLPTPFVAVYALSQGSIAFGTMERRFELAADGSYQFSARMESSGIFALVHGGAVAETSRGQLRESRFVADSYDYSDAHGKRHFALRFDHAAGRVLRSDQPAGWSAPMPDGVLDKLVYQMQMMVDLAAQPSTLHYAVADKDKLKEYVFINRGREAVSTGAGRYQTIKLERGAGAGERQTTVWCAAELGWLPVKVDYRERDGSVTTALLRSLRTP